MKSFHLCKTDYEEVKQRLDMRQVAETYGYKVNGKGTCLCPFHNDGHPSMKIYKDNKGFYCFSCGNGGDVIKFVSLLYGLKNEDACKKLIQDFALPIKTENLTYREKREREKKIEQRKKQDNFMKYVYGILNLYRQLLCEASRDPRNKHFVEAMQEFAYVEYRIECIKNYTKQYMADRGAVKQIGAIRERIINWY